MFYEQRLYMFYLFARKNLEEANRRGLSYESSVLYTTLWCSYISLILGNNHVLVNVYVYIVLSCVWHFVANLA